MKPYNCKTFITQLFHHLNKLDIEDKSISLCPAKSLAKVGENRIVVVAVLLFDLLRGLSVFHAFASNCQLPFWNQWKEKGKYVTRLGIEHGTSGS